MILRAAGIEPIPLPPRSPKLNASAQRFVRSIKEECLDRMILGEASLRHAVTEYVAYYHHERPRQGKGNLLLFPGPTASLRPRDGPVHSRQRLGGLLKFYDREAT
jgi:putative transposase